jgi:regulator of replication initiation timing
MALKRIVNSLEEVADSFRSLYTKHTGGLKKALGSERERASALDRELKELRKLVDSIGDPEQAKAAMAKLQQIEEKKLLDAGEVDKVIAQRVAALQADHSNQVNGFKTQLTEREQKLEALNGQLRKLTLDGTIREMASKKGLRPEAVSDAIARLTILGVGSKDGKPGVRWDLRDGQVVALRGDDIAYGKDPSRPMTWDEGFEILSEEAKHLFAPSSGGGAGDGAMRTSGRDVMLTREQAKDVATYRQAHEQAAKAGGQVVIQPLPLT